MLLSCLETASSSDFSLKNLPLGVFSTKLPLVVHPRCCTRLGDIIIDLAVLEEAGLFEDIPGLSSQVFCRDTLNAFLEHPRPVWIAFRQHLTELLTGNILNAFHADHKLQEASFHLVTEVELHLPIRIGDYTDFYASREHATNVGTMFRGKDNALQPNWLHLPVGYHGRSSTVVVSGTPIRRPCGQLQKDPSDPEQGSVHGPCKRLDFELEMAAVVGGPPNLIGQPMTLEQAKERVFGFMLMNDWSARDIQKWEYVPLGPFTSKNFATTVSPWIVTSLALEDFVAPTSAGQQDNPVPLPYLQDPSYSSYDVDLTVAIETLKQDEPVVVCRSNLTNVYWTAAQQLVHHSVTGCSMKAGDLLGSGTISGSKPDSFGSMLELSWNATKDVALGDETRKFLEDGDRVIMSGRCEKPGAGRIGFGECAGMILPAVHSDMIHPIAHLSAKERYGQFKLYSYWRSSSAWRVRIALAAKGLSFETIPVDITKGEHKTVEYLTKNPHGQVPCLECVDNVSGISLTLTQSVAIIEFLDMAFLTRRQLFPSDSADKAAALEMVEVINSGTQPLQNIFFLRAIEVKSGGQVVAVDEAKRVIEYGLLTLESLVKKRLEVCKGPYCLGSFSPTVVDAFLVPQMYNARRFEVDVERICPTLVAIDKLCFVHAWFKPSHPSAQPDFRDE
ncbi:hypothetical protein MPSEU_000217000 [Mayamaea pseudoterrestris]|nr:hypothetical protein MPSEU_000217000 [Mayamaea pseudoterrestris]